MFHKSERGFTMLELLISIAIFALIVPALSAGIQALTITNNRARNLTLVSLLAENKIEQLRSAGYNSLSVGTTDFSSEIPTKIPRPSTASYTISSPSTGLLQIAVTITYNDYNRTTTKTYTSLVGELGVGQ